MRQLFLLISLVLLAACTLTFQQRQITLPTLAVLPSPTALPPTSMPPSATWLPLPTMPVISTPDTVAALPTNPPTDIPPTQITSIPALVGSLNVTSAPGIVLRRSPSDSADVIAVLPGGTFASAQRRTSDQLWIEVVTEAGVAGWVKASEVYTQIDVSLLPALDLAPTLIVALPTNLPPTLVTSSTPVTSGDVPAMEHRLQAAPIFENLLTDRTLSIFAQGQGMGNRANVFTTVGDSNTSNGDFLQPIGMGADVYCNWGSYGDLHTTVAYFSAPPKATESNSFVHHSLTAEKGFSSASVLDPFWATDSACTGGESPLLCEYRTIKPSVAIIMLGNIDVSDENMGTGDYAADMRTIVETSIQQGVIPVLTTFVVIPDREVYERSLEFNMALLDLAASEQIPLINLWAAAQTLPNEGIGPDNTHLKAVIGSFCAFNGAQMQDGGTLRNLLTLQALDQLRQNVLAR